ncbi:MAG: PcfJ domain-containing protein [Erysipelotrichaceae bacterium]|nr:PcfJ domain-containing protein [Erysipelotrichaceae bacterium]
MKDVDIFDLLEIESLRDADLPEFNFDSFKDFHATEDAWGTSKRARPIKSSYIVVYSLWQKKLLARTFYIEEYYLKKERCNLCFEVNRQLAGNKYKLHCRLMNSGFGGGGFKVYKGEDSYGWRIGQYNRYHCYGLYSNYTGLEIISYYQFNDPFLYLSCSVHKYCGCTNDYPKYHNNELFEYLYKYQKHPQLEMLMKMKMEHLTKDLTGFRWSKKGVAILGIEKWEIPYLKFFNMFEYKKYLRKYCVKWHLTVAQAMIVRDLVKSDLTVSRRLIRYFEEENVDTYNYKDHLRYLDLLGLPHENKYLYPKDFHKAHQEEIDRFKVVKNSRLNDKIMKIFEELNKKYTFADDNFLIRPAKSYDELIAEGRILHHCVATYGQEMAESKCVIMVIRNKQHDDEPLYTLEFKNKNVVQCRGLKNCVPDDNAKDFVKMWANRKGIECRIF